MTTYARHFSTKATEQTAPIPGMEAVQVKNNAGGFVFQVSPWTQLRRFLVLGAEGGVYEVTEQIPASSLTSCSLFPICKSRLIRINFGVSLLIIFMLFFLSLTEIFT